MVFLRARCCDYDGRYWKQPLIDMLAELPNSWTIINGAVSNQNDPSGWEEEIFRKNGGTHDWGTVAVIYNLKHDAWVALLLNTDACHIRSIGSVCRSCTEFVWRFLAAQCVR